MTKKFQKKIESFICVRCHTNTNGNGYTNHCPNCLWSKHVDINPGDRLEQCRGDMEPVNAEIKKHTIILTHKCQKCGKHSICKSTKNDSLKSIITLINSVAKKLFF